MDDEARPPARHRSRHPAPASSAARTPRAASAPRVTGAGPLHRRHPPAAHALRAASCAARTRTRASSASTRRARSRGRGVVAVITGKRHAGALRHHPLDAGRVPARARAGALRRRRGGGGRRDRRAPRPRGGRAHRRRVRGAPRRDRSRRRDRRSPRSASARAARTTSPRRSSLAFGDVDAAARRLRRRGRGRLLLRGLARTRPSRRTARSPSSTRTASSRSGRRRRCRTTCTASSRACSRLSPARIRVIQPPIGGAFGGKSEPFSLEFCAAKLAMITGRPVKFLYTREEEFYAHRGRHPMRMHMKVGATQRRQAHRGRRAHRHRRRRLLVVRPRHGVLLGPAPHAARRSPRRTASARRATSPTSRPAGPKRGHGSVQPRFAFEVTLDKIAERLGDGPDRAPPAQPGRAERDARSTACASPRTASSSASTRVEAASGWKERRGKLGLRARARRRGERVHQRHELLHLPEPDAAERRAAQGRPLGRRHGLLRRRARSARAATRCSRCSSPTSSGSTSARCASSPATPISARSTSARTRRAARS